MTFPLTTEQRAAADSDAPRIALLAAPGSGKTATLVARVKRLLLAGYHPSEILMVTFTRKAAGEMRERIVEAMAETPVRSVAGLTVSTFHALAASLLRDYHDKLGLDRRFTIRAESDAIDLWLYVGEELGLFKNKKPTAEMGARGRKTRAASVAKKPEAQAAYDRHMQEARAVDYDGLQRKLLALVRMPEVAAQLRRRWPHVLVDETQDTSEQQQAILDALDPDHLFVVGDHAQAIYGFRGAHPEGFVALTEREGWTVLQLTANFRSKAPIVEGATLLGRQMATPGLEQVAGRGDALDDADHALRVLDLPAGIDTWAPLFVRSLEQVREGLGCDWAGCAVLSPTWWELERLQEHLEEAGIPLRLARRGGDVWQGDVMRWIVDGLRTLHNPHDYLSLYSYLTRLSVRVSMPQWHRCRADALASGDTMLQAACRLGGVAGGMAAALMPIGQAEGLIATVRLIAAALEGRVRAEHLDSRVAELEAAAKAIEAWVAEQDEAPTVEAFLDALSASLVDGGVEDTEDEEPAVTLSTIHGAKGLEWQAVWVLGCEEGLLPRVNDGPNLTDGQVAVLEEARRLFYVALTRGKDRVRLVWRSDRTRSRFVAEALGEAASGEEVGHAA